jgi:hypothetical protein
MENMFVVKRLPAAADTASLDGMEAGDLIALADGSKIICRDTAAATLTERDMIQFVAKNADGSFKTSVPIPRRAINNYLLQVATADVQGNYLIGGTTAETGLDIPNEGEGNITLSNNSYNHAIKTQRINVSVTKKAGETVPTYLGKVRDALNAAMSKQAKPFGVVTLVTTNISSVDYYALRVVTTDSNVDLSIGLDGIFAGQNRQVVAYPKVGLGLGADVVKMEKEFSRNRGNAGFIENSELWYGEPLQASASATYTMATLTWEGVAKNVTNFKSVANNVCVFAFDTSTYTLAHVTAFFTLLLSSTYLLVGGSVEGNPSDNNSVDGTLN